MSYRLRPRRQPRPPRWVRDRMPFWWDPLIQGLMMHNYGQFNSSGVACSLFALVCPGCRRWRPRLGWWTAKWHEGC